MESLKFYHNRLQNLQHQAERLTATGLSLITLFAEEANRLSREDEASRLKAVYSTVVEQLERVKCSESSASYAQSQINQIAFVSTLGMSLGRAMVSKGNRLSTFSNSLRSVSIKKPPFGNAVVCIGPGGLPGDVEVISISQLAREANRSDSETIQELRKQGYLLFNQEAFSRLIDKLVIDVREGRLHLPIPIETLTGVETLRLEDKRAEWVRCPRPQ